MSRQPLFMYYRAREEERQHRIRTAYNLKFNDEHFSLATPEFWAAWRAGDKDATPVDREGNPPIRRQYAPGKYPADQIGLQGQKPVWVVFVDKAAKERFDWRLAAQARAAAEGGIWRLGWHPNTNQTGMFLDERNKTHRSKRSPVVAWLNYNSGRYSVNVVDSAFKLTRPIPTSITGLGGAVEWVYKNSVWISSKS